MLKAFGPEKTLVGMSEKNLGLRTDDKGSVGNRIEYTGKQTWNFYKNLWKAKADTFVGLGTTAALTAGVAKSKTAQNILTKGFQALKNSNFGKEIGKEITPLVAEVAPFAKKGLSILKALPGPAKAVLAVGTILTTFAINRTQNKMLVKAGQIDQEYTDKAKLQKQLS